MNNRPKLTAMMESAQRVANAVPAWMLDSKRQEPSGADSGRNVPDTAGDPRKRASSA